MSVSILLLFTQIDEEEKIKKKLERKSVLSPIEANAEHSVVPEGSNK